MSSLRQSALKSIHLRSNHSAVPKTKNYKKNPSSEELKETAKLLAKKRGIKGYESMSEDRLLSAIKVLESVKTREKNFDDTKPKINFSKPTIEKIRKKFNNSRYKSKINEIRRSLYEIKKQK